MVVVNMPWILKLECKTQICIAFTVNYMVAENDMNIGDPDNTKKIYHDGNTDSGNVIEVRIPSHSIYSYGVFTASANRIS